MSLLERVKCYSRIRLRAWSTRHRRNIQCREFLRNSAEYGAPCPVCKSTASACVTIQFGEDCFEKGLCRKCEHLYSTWLQTNVAQASTQFGYNDENENLSTQVQLLSELVGRKSIANGSYLDFGVGGNRRSFEMAKELFPQHSFYGCDLFTHSGRNYFTTYDESLRC